MRLHPRLLIVLAAAGAILAVAGCSGAESRSPALTPEASRGQRLFQGTCAACHRADSTDPLNGPGLKGIFQKPYFPSGAPANDERAREVIKMGRRTMPPYGQILDNRQIDDLIAYLKTL